MKIFCFRKGCLSLLIYIMPQYYSTPRATKLFKPTPQGRRPPPVPSAWNSKPANKIYVKRLTESSKAFVWTRLQFQALMADRNMASSRYHGHIVFL